MNEQWQRRAAREAARRALDEDLAGYGDLAGGVFTAEVRAQVVAREARRALGPPGLRGGGPAASTNTSRCASSAATASASPPATCSRVSPAPAAPILALERTGLNFLGRLSGVATMTARFVAETEGTKARIAATRKTTPGLRALEKAAVVHGGGLPHRFGLFDAAMIKDNHARAAGGVAAAVAAVRGALGHVHGLEVEVDDIAQLDEALAAGADRRAARQHGPRPGARRRRSASPAAPSSRSRAASRWSACATLAATGVDVISAGALTTRSPWIDIALDLEE